jgi:hypothetical protein
MTASVATANLVLGAGYLLLACIVLIELYRHWREPGVGHFGLALAAIAFTCGPHHVAHGMHVGFEHQLAGRLDLVTVLVGLPPAAVFVWLRLEALGGRQGDRIITGTPAWIQALPAAGGAYVAMVLVVGLGMINRASTLSAEGVLSLASAGLFGWVAALLLRTQIRNRAAIGGWSLSGLSLFGLFATCSVMHTAVAMEMASQVRPLDVHLLAVDGAGIAAAMWFLVVVRAMTREVQREWGAAGSAAPAGA